MTAAQQRAVNRYNARKSTGPITQEGKERSCRNALKHGCCALDFVLPGEDAGTLQMEFGDWFAEYEPVGPAEVAMVRQIALATLKLDRLARRETAVVTSQMLDAKEHWFHDQADRLAALKALLHIDPATAVRELKRFGPGRRWVIDRWRFLSRWFLNDGYAAATGLTDEAIRLMGVDPSRLKAGSVDAYKLRLFSAFLRPDTNQDYLAYQLSPAIMHDDYCAENDGRDLPDQAYCLSELRRIVLHEINEWELDEARGLPYERADEMSRGTLSLFPADSADAKLALRYESMARSALHKSLKELERLQDERYAVEALATADPDVIAIADAAPEPVFPGARNEPDTPPEALPSVEPETSCDPSTETGSAEPTSEPVGVEVVVAEVAAALSETIIPNSPIVTAVIATSPPA